MLDGRAADGDEPHGDIGRKMGRRIVAGIGGLLVLGLFALYTFGVVLAAVAGVGVAAWIARRREKALSLAASWVGAFAATGAVSLLTLGLVGLMAMRAPAGLKSQMKHAMDSASAAPPPPPPAWIERIAPGASARANARANAVHGSSAGQAFGVWAIVVGGLIATGMLAILVGTAGWLPALLLGYQSPGVGSGPLQTRRMRHLVPPDEIDDRERLCAFPHAFGSRVRSSACR